MKIEQHKTPRTWHTEQIFLIAVCALFVGLFAGYALRGDTSARALAAQSSTRTSQPEQHASEQLTAAAVEQVTPLLAKLNSDPQNPDLLVEIGNTYFDGRQFPRAIDYYSQALALRPNDPDVRTDMGTAYFYSGDPDRAIAEFNAVLKTVPAHANALFNLGIVKWQGKSDAAGALAAWQQLLRTNPNYPNRTKVEQLINEVEQHARTTTGR